MVKDLFKKPSIKASVPADVSPEPIASASPVPAPGASASDEIAVLKAQLQAELARLQSTPTPTPPPAKAAKSLDWRSWALTGLVCLVAALSVLILRDMLSGGGESVGDGLTVLVLYESDPTETEASDEQKLALQSVNVAEWLDENCTKLNGHPAWRIVDKDLKLDKDEPVFQKLKDKPRDSVPWLYMSGGRREVSEAMVDGDSADFIKQMEKGK